MSWFKRKAAGIQTDTAEQNEIPDGQWIKDPETGDILHRLVLEENAWVSPKSGHHYALSAEGFFDLIFDRTEDGERAYTLHDQDLRLSLIHI